VNGEQLSPVALGRVAGFAEQQDVHAGTATVEEALSFSAAMRLAGAGARQRAELVASVIALLELSPLAGRLVQVRSGARVFVL
jgi:ABC-type multidrug transport system ATPase subunit